LVSGRPGEGGRLAPSTPSIEEVFFRQLVNRHPETRPKKTDRVRGGPGQGVKEKRIHELGLTGGTIVSTVHIHFNIYAANMPDIIYIFNTNIINKLFK
jgi:hypothetical protein